MKRVNSTYRFSEKRYVRCAPRAVFVKAIGDVAFQQTNLFLLVLGQVFEVLKLLRSSNLKRSTVAID
jgi:hypothetical protein